MMRFGKISELDPNKGLVRVVFEEDGWQSFWLSVVVPKSGQDKYYYMPDIGEHVACLMDENAESGVVLGSVWSKANEPAHDKGKDIASVTFADGSKVVFDRAAGVLTVETQGNIEVKTADSVSIEAAKTVLVKGPNGITLEGDTAIYGKLQVSQNIETQASIDVQGGITAMGQIESNTDVKALAISLLTHKHPTAPTGPPSPPIP